jgi:hypothetical protein
MPPLSGDIIKEFMAYAAAVVGVAAYGAYWLWEDGFFDEKPDPAISSLNRAMVDAMQGKTVGSALRHQSKPDEPQP